MSSAEGAGLSGERVSHTQAGQGGAHGELRASVGSKEREDGGKQNAGRIVRRKPELSRWAGPTAISPLASPRQPVSCRSTAENVRKIRVQNRSDCGEGWCHASPAAARPRGTVC